MRAGWSSSTVWAASARPGCSTRRATWSSRPGGSCSAGAATRPSAPCSCSPTSTRCARSCSAPRTPSSVLSSASTAPPGHCWSPSSTEVVEVSIPAPATAAIERRRAYDAVAAVLRRLSRRRPVLLAVDDLQDGGAATVDLLGFLAGRLSAERVLLVGAVRAEDEATISRLSDRATPADPRSTESGCGRDARLRGRTRRARGRGHGPDGRTLVERRGVPARTGRRGGRCAGVPGRCGADPRRAPRRARPAARPGRFGAARPVGPPVARGPRPDPRGRGRAAVRGAGPGRVVPSRRRLLRVRQRPDPGVRRRVAPTGAVGGPPPQGGRPAQ